MKQKYDTLMPKETWINKIAECSKSFALEVGVFKTIGVLSCIPLSLTILTGLSYLQPTYTNKLLSLGEYLSCTFSCGLCLLLISLYEYYYIDLIIKWRIKK